jgi:hypothetical protein
VTPRGPATAGRDDPLADLTIGVLSYRAHRTLERTVASHRASGLFTLPARYFIYFNAIDDADRALAERWGVEAAGAPVNGGIYGGFRAIAERTDTSYLLVLENDIEAIAGPEATARCLRGALDDMRREAIPVFCLRSREQPGQGLSGARKFARAFGVVQPLHAGIAARRASWWDRLAMRRKHLTLERFIGNAIYVEAAPERRFPRAWRRLPSGNLVTVSRYRNWSNQAVLVRRDFLLDVVLKRTATHPDPRTINGAQDIERALNRPWWRRQNVAMGHAREGIFTHARLPDDATPRG